MKDLNPPTSITLRHARNPSAPSSEEVWQSLQDYCAGIPERLERWKQTALTSQETSAQVEQHEPLSRDTTTALVVAVIECYRSCRVQTMVTFIACTEPGLKEWVL